MQVSNQYQIERAASTDSTRRVINGVFREGDRLIATNGRMLANVPILQVETEETDKCIIPLDAFKLARKHSTKSMAPVVYLNGGAEILMAPGKPKLPYIEGNYPNWRQVVPKNLGTHRVCLNPALLNELAKAIGIGPDQGAALYFGDDQKAPITIRRCGSDAFGVLMPMAMGNRDDIPDADPAKPAPVSATAEGEELARLRKENEALHAENQRLVSENARLHIQAEAPASVDPVAPLPAANPLASLAFNPPREYVTGKGKVRMIQLADPSLEFLAWRDADRVAADAALAADRMQFRAGQVVRWL